MPDKKFQTRLRNKIDTLSNWNTNNPTLLSGEVAYSIETGVGGNTHLLRAKIGDGTSTYTQLPFVDSRHYETSASELVNILLADIDFLTWASEEGISTNPSTATWMQTTNGIIGVYSQYVGQNKAIVNGLNISDNVTGNGKSISVGTMDVATNTVLGAVKGSAAYDSSVHTVEVAVDSDGSMYAEGGGQSISVTNHILCVGGTPSSGFTITVSPDQIYPTFSDLIYINNVNRTTYTAMPNKSVSIEFRSSGIEVFGSWDYTMGNIGQLGVSSNPLSLTITDDCSITCHFVSII